MHKFTHKKMFLLFLIFLVPSGSTQSTSSNIIDNEYLQSLPESVRNDVLSEMEKNKKLQKKNVEKRPSTRLQMNEIVKEWENYKKKNELENKTERYGLKLFNTMQSSFMPLNEPNFGNNYVVDYGDFISINKYGSGTNQVYELEIERDGSILIPEIGRVSVAGLNFDQVTELIKNKYKVSFIGAEVFVTLSEIRDINVLVTGNVEFPGVYTLSGNSNILQALNVVGGVTENGSLRNIVLKRKGKPDQYIDLYKVLIFGDIVDLPFLMSGDSIYVEPVKNLVRAGYGFNNVAIYELKDDETISDLVYFAGGLKAEAKNESLRLVRFENSNFISYEVNTSDTNNYKIANLDSIYAHKDKIGTISISGYVKHPGKYSISSSDRMLDIIKRAGGYIDSAYPFAGSLFRESSKELEYEFTKKTYNNLISYIAANPNLAGGTGEGLSYILSELKNYEPSGRFIAEFDEANLKSDIQRNIYLNDGDTIHIPSYRSNVYVFGEVGNQGSVLFDDDNSLIDYITKSGGLTRLASSEFMFVVSPNGETMKVETSGLRKFISQPYDIYPGSVIFVPRHIGKIEGLNLYATIAPIFSSLALSIASVNSIND